MSKHNNSTNSLLSRRCSCGRYITLGEEHAGLNHIGYKCPDCLNSHKSRRSLTREEYYEQMNRINF